jgi:hypothetical protein
MRSVTARRTVVVRRPARPARPAPLAAGLIAVVAAASALVGCLDRQTVSDDPTVKTNFETTVQQTAVDQVDILFMIDNSTSMGDKQKLLSAAVPNLVSRLVQPNCLDSNNAVITDASGNAVTVDPSTLTCATGTPEFPAVHDMHIGIVSSSLGDFGVSNGGDSNKGNWVCPGVTYTTPGADGGVVTHSGNESQNDHAQLLNRTDGFSPSDGTADPPAATDANPENYLSWFPTVAGNTGKAAPLTTAITTSTTLQSDFSQLVKGVQQFGCGFEGQLESWYQFLIQPDPWASIQVSGTTASRVGINTTLLQQRQDFLRPNSLVAVIAVSDEDDSTVDPGAFSGTSWVFEDRPHLPQPTAACATDPSSAACTSCQLAPTNPECVAAGGGVAAYPTADDPDNPNTRFALMKKRFGIDPQYPISRYLNGLVGTNGSFTVPDRNGEKHGSDGRYAPTNDCTNPLYASTLPDLSKLSATAATDNPVSQADLNVLCQLPTGSRQPSLVFFGFIGGVPWQLLTHDPTNATTDAGVTFIAQSSGDDIPAATWTQMIGNNPEGYDYSGQSPYMQVSLTPRAGLQPVTAASTADPFNGREYTTNGADLEYACTFDLPPSTDGTPTGTDCSDAKIAADQPNTLPYDGLLGSICDCANGQTTDSTGKLVDVPPTGPLCSSSNVNQQVRGKAYPGIREFTLVHEMDQQAAANGIAASLCPRYSDPAKAPQGASDPNYGYNPAVQAIIAKLKNALGNTCLPRTLTLTDNMAPCSILELLPNPGDESACDPALGLSVPAADVLARYRQQQAASGNGDASADLAARPVCQVNQLSAPCANSSDPGWCYETLAQDPGLGTCPQAIKFSAKGAITGALVSLECLESQTAAGDAGTTSLKLTLNH